MIVLNDKRKLMSLMLVLMLIFLVSCVEENPMNKISNIIINDEISAVNTLSNSYDLKELESYFGNYHYNEAYSVTDTNILTISEVNNHFPIEFLRTSYYSLYKVKQGGYYYVFWGEALSNESDNNIHDTIITYCTYISSAKTSDFFKTIQVGISTLKDVYSIDPWLELCLLKSSGIYSYSYLNSNSIVRIEYENITSNYNDMVVKSVDIISRDVAYSIFGSILLPDLP